MAGERIPLTQMKTMRETLRERNLLTEFSEEHPYSLSQNATNDQNIIYHPLRNYKDVSVLGGWCSTAPPGALALHWAQEKMPVGLLGLGLLQESKHGGTGTHSQRRRHSSSALCLW